MMTETSEKDTAFKDCVDPQEDSESREHIAKTIIVQMEKIIKVEKYVEGVWVGTICDNVSCNRTTRRLIEEKYSIFYRWLLHSCY